MKYFQRMPIDEFVKSIITEDRETNKITDSWNIEREEVIRIVVNHFKELGIFFVEPMAHAQLIYDNIQFQLRNSLEIATKIRKVNEEIERAKARHTRHHA